MIKYRNLYNFLRENSEKLKIDNDLLEFFKNNIRFTTKHKMFELEKYYPNFKSIYEEFLKSDKFKKMINIIKFKNDEEYLKLFFRHSKNFLNLYVKETPYNKIGRRLGKKLKANKVFEKVENGLKLAKKHKMDRINIMEHSDKKISNENTIKNLENENQEKNNEKN